MNITNASDALFNFIYSTASHKPRSFGNEFVDVTLASFPVMNGHVANITNVAQGRQR